MAFRNCFLLIDPVDDRRFRTEQALQALGHRVIPLARRSNALKILYLERISVIVTAANLPDGRWQDLIGDTAPMDAAPNVVVLSGENGRPSPMEASQLGAFGVLAEPCPPEETQLTVAAAAESWEARNRPHLLGIDDEPMVLQLIARILEADGMKVSGATTGTQAVEILKSNPDISVAILDWQVGDLTGELILDRLRAISPRIQAIVISGCPPADVETAFAGRRVRRFLSMPFSPQALVSTVRFVQASAPRPVSRAMQSPTLKRISVQPLRARRA